MATKMRAQEARRRAQEALREADRAEAPSHEKIVKEE
jgi:hypothetical protein